MWRQNKKSKPSIDYDFCKLNCFAWRYVVVYTRNDTEQVILNSNQSENKKTGFPFQVTRIQTTDKGASLRDLYPGAAYHIQVWQQDRPHLRQWTTTLTIFDTSFNDPHGPYSPLCRSLLWATVFNRNPTEVSKLWLRTLRATSPSQRSRWSLLRVKDYRVKIFTRNAYDVFLTKSLQPDRISLAGQPSKFEMEDADLLSVHGVPRQVPHVWGSRPESVECSYCCGTYCNHVHPHRSPAWRAVWDSGSIKELFLTCAVSFHSCDQVDSVSHHVPSGKPIGVTQIIGRKSVPQISPQSISCDQIRDLFPRPLLRP